MVHYQIKEMKKSFTPLCEAKFEKHEEIINILKNYFCKFYGISETEFKSPENDEKCCKVCWEREVDTVLLWCGHVAICLYCSQFLSSCPMCCQPIQKVQRVYLS